MITKYKKLIFAGAFMALALLTTSCEWGEQEDYTGMATISATSPDITITADFDPVNGVEQDATYEFTLTLSEAQISDVIVNVFQSGGTATEGEDFVINTHEVIIPAYTTSAVGSFTTYADVEPEDSETLSITVGDEKLANTVYTPQTFNFTIENYESENLDIAFDWGMGIDWNGNTYGTCDNIDLDIMAFIDGTDFTGDWQAATGDCPETYTMTPADYPDGVYVFYHDLWSNGFAGLNTDTMVPITATFVQSGVFSETVVQDNSQAINSDMYGYADDPSGSHMGYIATVTVAGGVYTISSELPDASKMVDANKIRLVNRNK